MRNPFSFLWQKPQIIWVLIPFALGTVVSTSVMRSMSDDESAQKFGQGGGQKRAHGQGAQSDVKRVKKVKPAADLAAIQALHAKADSADVVAKTLLAVKADELKAPGVVHESVAAPSAPLDNPQVAAGVPEKRSVTTPREELKAEMEHKAKLEGEGREETTQANALSAQIQQQRLVAQQLATKLAQKVAEQERELELRRLTREKAQAEILRKEETEKLAEIKRITEENRIAKDKLIAQQAKLAKEEEIERARKIADEERTLLQAKLKAQREEEQRAKDEKELHAARQKMALELQKLEEEKTKAQKLRYEREKEFILEQLKVESLKAKLAAQERSLLERDMDKNVKAAPVAVPIKSTDMAASAAAKKKSEVRSAVAAQKDKRPPLPMAKVVATKEKKPKESRAKQPKANKDMVNFVHVVIRRAVNTLALSFDIQKADPRQAFAEGRVVVIGKYVDKEGKPVFLSSQADAKGATSSSAQSAEGIAFKVKNIVKKRVEIPRPLADAKLVDLWLVARDQAGNNISTHRVANF